jgi:fatty-acid desaturase
MFKPEYRRQLLFISQFICHLLTIYALFIFGLTDWIKSFAVYSVTASLGISVGYHRLLTHKSFTTNKFFRFLASFAGTYGLVGSSLAWVNTHRAHHKNTDTHGDPHSPSVHGYGTVQWLSMFKSPGTFRYVPDLCREPLQLNLHKYYYYIHAIIAGSLYAFLGLKGMMMYYAVPACILWNMGSLINTICHSKYGYVNTWTPDKSKNNFILGFLVFGEGWHNNHHADPRNKRFGKRWFEIDLSHYIIRIIENNKTLK